MTVFCWLLYTRSALLYAGTGNRARVLQEGEKSRDKSRRPRCFCARLDLVNTGKEGGVGNRAEMHLSEHFVVIGGNILLLLYVDMSKHEHAALAANEGARWHNATPQKTQTQQATPLGHPASLSQEGPRPWAPFFNLGSWRWRWCWCCCALLASWYQASRSRIETNPDLACCSGSGVPDKEHAATKKSTHTPLEKQLPRPHVRWTKRGGGV